MSPQTNKRFLLVSSPSDKSNDCFNNLKSKYNIVSPENANEADVIIPIGGDNTMLKCIHEYSELNLPFFGINRGHVGFLLNEYESEQDLENIIARSKSINLWLLQGTIEYADGSTEVIFGFNDIYLSPIDGQTLKMNLTINKRKLESVLIGDGVIVSTPQGSTGYNRVAGGSIIQSGSPILQLTPKLCTIGTRREIANSFIRADNTEYRIDFIDYNWRQCNVFYDGMMIQKQNKLIKSISFKKSKFNVNLLFNSEQGFYDKVYGIQYHEN